MKPGVGRGVEGLEFLRRKNFKILLNNIDAIKSLNGKKVLEIGCGAGWFLDEATAKGINAIAIEPDGNSAASVRSRGHEVHTGFFPDVLGQNQSFDIIIFNDVFEHLNAPNDTLRNCNTYLSDDGLLVINLPSSSGIGFRAATLLYRIGAKRLFERLWQKGYASPHLTYFSPKSLKKTVEKFGFEEVATFRLDSLSADGLWRRIRSDSSPIYLAVLNYLAALAIMPILNLFPSDAHVSVFQCTNKLG